MKINSKFIINLHSNPKYIKLLKRNMREKIFLPYFGKDFLNITTKAQPIKEKKIIRPSPN